MVTNCPFASVNAHAMLNVVNPAQLTVALNTLVLVDAAKPKPLTVTAVPTGPLFGVRVIEEVTDIVTINLTPLASVIVKV